MSRPFLLASLLLLAGAGGAQGEAHFAFAEVLRPNAGRASEMAVAGYVRGQAIEGVEGVTVQDGVVTLVLRSFFFFDTDIYPKVLSFELPPLAAGTHEVAVMTQPSPGVVIPAGRYPLEVHPELRVELDPPFPTAADDFRIRVASLGYGAGLGRPRVEDGTILLPISLACGFPPCTYPPEAWEEETELLPALAAGTYQLKLVREDASYGEARRVWEGEVAIVPAEARVQGGRFLIAVELDPPHAGAARLVEPPTADAALFYFFSRANWEVMAKVLDGCILNGHFWVYAAASTDVGYLLRVEDLETGRIREYPHPAGTPAPALTDAEAFDCP